MALHLIDGLKVRTDCICPPIPVRDFDWCAVLDDYYDGAPDTPHGLDTLMGTGINENAAIDDLFERVAELREEAA